jgi:hypothetical protein
MKDVPTEKMIFVGTRPLLEDRMLNQQLISTVLIPAMTVQQEKLAWRDRLCILTTKLEL